ncbi:MAG: 30S ribosomal protein S3ae [Euryarchaeota archaeon]|nr:30S ribosomal protein S3ae [Euryarchaeota archaeon]
MAAKSAKARTAARKQRDKWKAKRWFTIRAPRLPHNFKVIGETLAETPENVIGRIYEITQNELDGDFTRMHVKLRFRVNETLSQDALTEFIGHEVQRDHFRRQIRRNRGKVDLVVDVVTEDGYFVRYKMVMISSRRIKSSQATSMRNAATDLLYTRAASTTWLKIQEALLDGTLENEVKDVCAPIHKVRTVLIHKSELRQSGVVFDDGPTLDEIHAQEARDKAAAKEEVVDAEAADVLAAAEAGEAISELVDDDAETSTDEPTEASPKEEVPAEEDNSGNLDYESMTVAELKTLLKEAGKPVSGKKAELIERLKE